MKDFKWVQFHKDLDSYKVKTMSELEHQVELYSSRSRWQRFKEMLTGRPPIKLITNYSVIHDELESRCKPTPTEKDKK